MIENFLIVAIVSLVFGVFFFLADFYEHTHPKLHISLIAGISLAYFFLVLLPEVAIGIPVIPFEIVIFEYLFVVIGFSFVHVSEKLILQKVEANSQKRMRKLLQKEKTLEEVERGIEKILTKELTQKNLDESAVRDIAQTISSLNQQEEEMLEEINRYKIKIQNRISEDLSQLRFFTNFTYHFLIGIILAGLLSIEFISGILFFIFAWSRAIITNRSESHIIFTDLEIYEKTDIDDNILKRYILASATIGGILFKLILDLIFPLNALDIELFYIIYSFISGVILYTIVREVIPEKEKGKPLYFILGFVGYTIVIFFIELFTGFVNTI
jgi:zinc transporter ZupT